MRCLLFGTVLSGKEKIELLFFTMEIYVTGLIAYETAQSLLAQNQEAAKAHFPAFFLREFAELARQEGNFCIEKNTKNLYSKETCFLGNEAVVCEIKAGGIFAALWQACEAYEADSEKTCGCEIDLARIPIDQHVTELLEFFAESPFEVSSQGAYVVIAGEAALGKQAGGFTRIGRVTAKKDRVVKSKDTVRYLTPPKRQQTDITDRKKHKNEIKKEKETTR